MREREWAAYRVISEAAADQAGSERELLDRRSGCGVDARWLLIEQLREAGENLLLRCQTLLKDGAAIQFVMDAFGHLKAIGASDGAKPLLDKAGVTPDDGVTGLDDAFLKAATQRFWDREPSVRPLA